MPLNSKRFEISYANFAVLRAMLYCCTVAVLGFAGVMILGCGSSSYGVTGSVVGPFFTGSVKNGSRPVANALIQLYAAGEGKGIKNQTLLHDKTYTGIDGQFHVSSAYTCPSPMAQVYVLAEGGSSNNDGDGAGNSASTQMAALGNCSDLSGVTNAEVSELTTVASISVLAPFMSTIDTLGAGQANAQALSDAFKVTRELSDTLKEVTSDSTLPQAQVESVQKAATLANVLAACANTTGGSIDVGSACGSLFSYTRSNQGVAPLNTAAAMLEISNNPTHNVDQIFSLSTGTRPFRPALDSAPADWRISLSETPPPPVFSPAPGRYSGPQTVTLTESAPGTRIYYTIDGAWHQYTGAFTLPFSQTIRAIAIANSISLLATGAYTISAPTPTIFPAATVIASASAPIAYGSGFTFSGLKLNGAKIVGNALQLTDGGIFEGTTAWFTTPVNIQRFTTDFTFQQTSANADGFTFTLQNAEAGTTAVGANGGDLGYAGIGSSIAVKFDLYNNAGEGVDSTGFYSGGSRPSVPSLDMTSSGVNLHDGHIMHANLAYDGTNLNLTLTDTMTGHVFTATSAINIPSLVGGSTAYAGFTAGTGGLSATQNILTWTYAAGGPAPTFSPASGTYASAQSVTIADANASAAIYYTTDGTIPTTSSTQYTAPLNITASETLKAIAVAPGFSTSSVSSGSYLIASASTPIAYGSGLTSSGLSLNGAKIVGNALQLTDGGLFEGTTAWFTTPVNIQRFTTDFTFQQTSANADGFTFTLQNAATGTTAVGANGGDLGYAGIGPSVAVKFDLYNNAGEGVDSTGLYSGGNRPTVPSLDMTSSGIDLHAGHIMHANLAYDGTNLTLTLTDTMTGHVFTTTSAINIPSLVGGPTAYAGFTAGTGGLSAVQNILSWTYAPLMLTLTPATVSLAPSQTQQFVATVTGSKNTEVSWSLSPALGSVTSTGLYTAPSTIISAQIVTITATSAADTSTKATSTISLVPPVAVALTPISVTLTSSQMQQFSPAVTGSTNTAVTWTLSAAIGSISATGLYTAPSSISSAQGVTVIATSVADTTKKASASIFLIPPVSVTLTPGSAALSPLQTQQFISTVTGSTNTAVTWTLSPAVGSISTAGLYTTTPTVASIQTITVTATSVADHSKQASAVVTLVPPAATYYVDNKTGSDANTGTSQSAPFATISKINSLSLVPGQVVAFRSGEEWHEELTISRSGVLGSPITFTSYGAGAQPIISAADLTATPWKLVSTNVWSHSQTNDPKLPNYSGEFMTSVASVAAVAIPNAFYWDGTSTIYAYSVADPSSMIEIPQRASAVTSTTYGQQNAVGSSFITLSNLEFRGAQTYDVFCGGGVWNTVACANWDFEGDTFNVGYSNELYWLFAENVTSPNLVIHNSIFKNGGASGIKLGNGGTMNALISHNSFVNLAKIFNPTYSENNNADAVYGFSQDKGEYQSNVEVSFNTCSNIGVNSSIEYGGCYHPDTVTSWNMHDNIAQNTVMPGINIEKSTGTSARYNLLANTGQYRYTGGLSIRAGEGINIANVDVENNTAYGGWWACNLGITQEAGAVTATAIVFEKNICFGANSGTQFYADVGARASNSVFVTNNFGVAAKGFIALEGVQIEQYASLDALLGYSSESRRGDPQFVSPSSGNFLLQPTSPALGIGAYPSLTTSFGTLP